MLNPTVCGEPYLVIEFAEVFEVPGGVLEDDSISLLGDEEAQREGQVVFQHRVLEATRRLLHVPHLSEVATLGIELDI